MQLFSLITKYSHQLYIFNFLTTKEGKTFINNHVELEIVITSTIIDIIINVIIIAIIVVINNDEDDNNNIE